MDQQGFIQYPYKIQKDLFQRIFISIENKQSWTIHKGSINNVRESDHLSFARLELAGVETQSIVTRNSSVETCARLLFMLLQDFFASAKFHRVHKNFCYRKVYYITCVT